MNLLLLWDIDGTLIDSGGAGVRALRVALRNVFGIADALDDIEFAGRTDRWIARRVLEKFGLGDTDENVARYLDGYVRALPGELGRPGARVLPGVQEILDTAVARGDVALGLLTGNVRRGAEAKLGHHGLWSYFAFGAFADDSEFRDELGPHGLERACLHHSVTFPLQRVWVIGDTPHDITCGRALGAKTLAVATGRFDPAALAAHHPTTVLADLSNVGLFWRTID